MVVSLYLLLYDREGLQLHGCRALCCLAQGGHEEAKRRLVEAGASAVLERAQKAFPNSNTIKKGVPSLAVKEQHK